MTTDNYAPCPCGSGKKMKFCKCVDQPQEYDKIVRFIEGGQEIAALDRVNQLLAKSPNAAWLLAIKGELALSLREIEAFKDTAHRFLKLKPDNPLALTMRSFVALIDQEPLENAARLLLDGLSESRESLPALAMHSMRLLCARLRTSSKAPLRFFWSRLLEQFEAADEEHEQEPSPPDLYSDNLLAMSPIALPHVSKSAAWAERANEVNALISAFRYAQAETKLRAILRDYPDQSGPLLQLLQVQLVLLDQDGAASTARKLSLLRDQDELTRDYYAALALELEDGKPGLSPAPFFKYCEITSDEAARNALAQLPNVTMLQSDSAREPSQMIAQSVGDEVPATNLYNVLSTKTSDSGVVFSVASGTIALMGRQTDKPARALILMMNIRGEEGLFEQLVSALAPIADLPDPSAPRKIFYLEAVNRSRYVKGEEGRADGLPEDVLREAFVQDIVNLPLPALDNMTLLEAAEHEPKRAMVRAVLTHLEGCHHVLPPPGTFNRVYETLQFTRPQFEVATLGDTANFPSLLSLVRCDVAKATDEHLNRLFVLGLSLHVESLAFEASKELLKRPRSPELDKVRSFALDFLSAHAESLEEAISLLEELETSLAAENKTVGEVIMRRFDLLHRTGQEEAAQGLLAHALVTYPDDPYMLSVWQYINQQAQRGNAGNAVDDGTLLSRMPRRAEPEPESSLVLPGHAGPGSSEAGKSKLWIPGS